MKPITLLILALSLTLAACEKKASDDSASGAAAEETTSAPAASSTGLAPDVRSADGAAVSSVAPERGGEAGDPLAAITAEHAEVGGTPEGALRLWIREAARYHEQPEVGAVTLGYLTIDFKGSPGWRKLPTARTFVERLESRPWIFRSYAKDSAPTNDYAMDPEDFELAVEKSHPDKAGDRGHAVFLRSSGADSPRPIYMKKSSKSGLYFVSNFANAYVDIRKPVDPDAETFE